MRAIRTGATVTMWVLACLAAHAQETPPQAVHRAGFTAVSDEVYAVLEQFYALDADLPLEPRTVESWETPAANVEKVVFTSGNGERVPGVLALPKDRPPPYPAALLIHGLGSDRNRWWEEDRAALPDGLLVRGIAVMAIDLRFHGERAALNDYQSPVYLTFGNTLFVRSRDMQIQSAIDCRRALAYLRGREEIDPARIGLVGYSMGAMIGLTLAALEPDLVAVVGCALPTRIPVLPADPFQFAPRTRAATLLLIGRSDWLSSPADVRMLLEMLPTSDKTLTFFEAGHRLPPAFAKKAMGWIAERLARPAAGG